MLFITPDTDWRDQQNSPNYENPLTSRSQMPPTQGQKRPRMEEQEQEPKMDEPKIIKEKAWMTLNKYGNITTTICKKKESILKLSQHITAETAPKSLQWKPNVFVSAPFQGEMTDTVCKAACLAQKMILEKLIEIRRDELDQLEESRKQLLKTWEDETRLTLSQLQSEEIWSGDLNALVTKLKDELSTKLDERQHKVELIEFAKRKKKEESAQKSEERKQQEAIDKTLTSPEISELRKICEKLTKEIETLKGKAKPKPEQEKKATTGGGKNASRNKKSFQNKKKANQAKEQENNGRDHGNKKPPSRSKRTTNQSASKQKNSRKKRG